MPSVPISFSVVDSPSGSGLPFTNATLLLGTATAGTDNAMVLISQTSVLTSTFTSGPLVDAAAQYLAVSNRPLYCMRVNDSVPASISSPTYTRIGSSSGTVVDNSSSPVNDYQLVIEILTTGTVAATSFTFRYSLDGGDTWSGEIQGAASYSITAAGISLTFADAGGGPIYFEDGDLISFTTTAPGYGTSDVQAALDAWIASGILGIRRVHLLGVGGTALKAAVQTRMNTAAAAYHFARFIMESDDQSGGESVATWATGVLSDYSVDSDKVAVFAGWSELVMANSGRQYRRPAAWSIGPRMAAIDYSQDPGWVSLGPLDSVVVSETYPLPQDALTNTQLEGRGYTTLQTYRGLSGAYCSAALMRVQSTSDFYRFAHCQVMDRAREVVYLTLLPLINGTVAANSDGTIAEEEAQSIESLINSALKAELVDSKPQRISPRTKHDYAIVDRTNNIVDDEQLLVTVRMTPRGFIGTIAVTIGFDVSGI